MKALSLCFALSLVSLANTACINGVAFDKKQEAVNAQADVPNEPTAEEDTVDTGDEELAIGLPFASIKTIEYTLSGGFQMQEEDGSYQRALKLVISPKLKTVVRVIDRVTYEKRCDVTVTSDDILALNEALKQAAIMETLPACVIADAPEKRVSFISEAPGKARDQRDFRLEPLCVPGPGDEVFESITGEDLTALMHKWSVESECGPETTVLEGLAN